jgi:hypothetical protein
LSNATETISANITNINVLCSSNPIVATPIFSPTPGNYGTAQPNITITSATSGATIHFTKDGTTPTTSSTVYTNGLGHIWFLAGRTLKAIAVKSGSTDSAVATAEYSYLPLKSGQTICHNQSGNLISCSVTGHDGEFQRGVARSYTDNGDTTVTDNATGLLWQKCSVGQTGGACTGGGATTPDWTTAQTNCSALTTVDKIWRLPSILELATLPDYGIATQPPLDIAIFPPTPSNISFNFWSSTTSSINTLNAQNVGSYYATTNSALKSSSHYVRCVSGEIQTSFVKFVDNGNGTILDKQTGLTWQKCSFAPGQDSLCALAATTHNWTTAVNNCNNLNLASRTWRLPNIKELMTILDSTVPSAPTIDTSIFPSTDPSPYWSSTTGAPSTIYAWDLNFSNGSITYNFKTSSFRVRCVSGP